MNRPSSSVDWTPPGPEADRPLPTVTSIRGGDRGYLAYHAPRYRYLLELAARFRPSVSSRILDIGPSPFSRLLASRLCCRVDTLGLEPESDCERGHHFHLDLNTVTEVPHPVVDLPSYSLVVMAEVLEHLHTAPVPVLRFLHNHVVEGGYLFLQTPNAASLPKRLKLLAGRNPYDEIRADRSNPGHFREYTLRELRSCSQQAGFEVVESARRFYFDARFAHHDGPEGTPQPLLGGLKNLVYRALPPFLREGLTLVLRRFEGRAG